VPTAYLSPSQLQDLTNVSSTAPSSGDNGKALVWNNTAGKWQAEQVAYSNLSGAPTLGTMAAQNANNVAITGGGASGLSSLAISGTTASTSTTTGALTVAGGVGIQGTLNSGFFQINPPPGPRNSGLVIQYPANTNNADQGFILRKTTTSGEGFFSFLNGSSNADDFQAVIEAQNPGSSPSFWVIARDPLGSNADSQAIRLNVRNRSGSGEYPSDRVAIAFSNFISSPFWQATGGGAVSQTGTLAINNSTASNNTATGALTVGGGVGIVGNLHVGGTKINFANLPTSLNAAVAIGDLWRDGDVIKVRTS
jgi:hypothetical protein